MQSCRLTARKLTAQRLTSPNSLPSFDFLLPAWSNIGSRNASTETLADDAVYEAYRETRKPGRGLKRYTQPNGVADRHRGAPYTQPLDIGSSDLKATLRRLDVHSRPIDHVSEEVLNSLDSIYRTGEIPSNAYKSEDASNQGVSAADPSTHRARYNLLRGLNEGDWRIAYQDGWKLLKGRHQDDIGLDTIRTLVRLGLQEMGRQSWTQNRDMIDKLILPVATRELGSQEKSIVAEWIIHENQQDNDTAAYRVHYFWSAFMQTCAALKAKRQSTGASMEVPNDLFTMAMYVHFLAAVRGTSKAGDPASCFPAFVSSFVKNVELPQAYSSAGAYDMGLRQRNFRQPATRRSREARWHFWCTQIELVRMWSRTERGSLVLPFEAWRDRRNERAALRAWTHLKEGLDQPASSDAWLRLNWSSDGEAARATEDALIDAQSAPGELATASTPTQSASDVEGRQNAAPKLQIRVTQSLISNLLQTLHYFEKQDVAGEVMALLKDHNCPPTTTTWRGILLGLSQRGTRSQMKDALDTMSQRDGVQPDALCLSIIINSYFRSGKYSEGMDQARALLDNPTFAKRSAGGKLPARVFNIILNAVLWNDSPAAASDFLQEMDARGIVPDIYTINLLLRYYSRPKQHDLRGVASAMQLIEKHKLTPDVVTFTTLLDALLRAGQHDAVNRVRSMMAELGIKPNVVTYGTMIDHLTKRGVAEGSDDALTAARQLLLEMQSTTSWSNRSPTHMRPSEITYTSLLQGYANYATAHHSSSHLQEAEVLLQDMLDKGISDNRVARSALLSANIAFDRVDRALHHFNAYRSLKRGRSTNADAESGAKLQTTERVPFRVWQTLLHGLVTGGHIVAAREVLAEMRSLGLDTSSGSLARLAARIEDNTAGRA